MLFNGLSASRLMLSIIVICHNVSQEGLCSWEDNESCSSSLTFHRYSSTIKALACRGQHYHPAGEWALATRAISGRVILALPSQSLKLRLFIFLQPENHRLTLIWNDTTLNETKLTPYYTVQCLNVNNQSYLVFVDTFRSVQLNSVDVEVIVTSTEEVMLSVSQQYYRETIGPIFMKLGGRL